MTTSSRHTIRCGPHIVGCVTVTNVDMWHLSGPFEPGPDFPHYEEAINSVRTLQLAAESDAEIDWVDAIEIVNTFGFVAESSNGNIEAICDFQLDSDNKATFKSGV